MTIQERLRETQKSFWCLSLALSALAGIASGMALLALAAWLAQRNIAAGFGTR